MLTMLIKQSSSTLIMNYLYGISFFLPAQILKCHWHMISYLIQNIIAQPNFSVVRWSKCNRIRTLVYSFLIAYTKITRFNHSIFAVFELIQALFTKQYYTTSLWSFLIGQYSVYDSWDAPSSHFNNWTESTTFAISSLMSNV